MADIRTVTGSRDDLTVDASRCLRMRFSESGCRRCIDICPHGAVSLEGGLAIDPEQCRGCLLCTAICPSGALEQGSDFSACLARLLRVPEPVLGCIRNKDHSHVSLACLGGLSEEHLLTLCHSLTGTLTLHLTACSDCQNSTMIAYLRQRIEVLSAAGVLECGCSIVTAESAQDINYRDESVDRRSFFKFFRTSLFQSAAVMLSANNEQAGGCNEYSVKRLPIRRGLLNGIRNKLSHKSEVQVIKQFDSYASFGDACTKCQGCVAVCPTGALQTGQPDDTPTFDQRLCTGCGLCSEFCLDGAVRISTEISKDL